MLSDSQLCHSSLLARGAAVSHTAHAVYTLHCAGYQVFSDKNCVGSESLIVGEGGGHRQPGAQLGGQDVQLPLAE